MFLRAKIRYSLSVPFRASRSTGGAVFISALLAVPAVQAQDAVPAPAAPAIETPRAYRNAVRFDVGGVLISTLAYNMLNENFELLFPVLASYERQLSPRFSLVGEGLLNGGTPEEQKAGFSVQGRYYVLPGRAKHSLTGVYLAPVLGYRTVTIDGYRQPPVHRRFTGAGALAGWQVALPKTPRLVMDASFGLMGWQKTGRDKVDGPLNPNDYPLDDTYYEREKVVIDARLGIGYRF